MTIMDHLTEILVALANHKVDFIVVGDVSAVSHSFYRVTMDVAIRREKSNAARSLLAMKELRSAPIRPAPPEVLRNQLYSACISCG